MLWEIQYKHFNYFVNNQDPDTGLILDRSTKTSPASIAAVGFALTAYPLASQRGFTSREKQPNTRIRFSRRSPRARWVPKPQERSVIGTVLPHARPQDRDCAESPTYWNSELSSIDTALLITGALFARNFFTWHNEREAQIREMAQRLFDNVEWDWMSNDKGMIYHQWTPENGMTTTGYNGYSEALLMYILALGSTTHKMPDNTWDNFMGGSSLTTHYGQTYVICPDSPLFVYQYPHCWIDFRDIQDAVMRRTGLDYFENSRRATLAQYKYAFGNPNGYRGYSAENWGLTACDGPGDVDKTIDGVERRFWGYMARGCPAGPDDGTIAPTAALSSMPFTPELSMPLLKHWYTERKELLGPNGFADSFNPTFDPTTRSGWIDPETIGIDQGPILLMIENYRNEFAWKIMRNDPNLRLGLQRAGFSGGWLNTAP